MDPILAMLITFLIALSPLGLMYYLGDKPAKPLFDDEDEDEETEPKEAFDVLLDDHPELEDLEALSKRIEEVS